MLTINTTPAYGRKFKTRKKAIESWENNQDFLITDIFGIPKCIEYIGIGTYINQEDFKRYCIGGDTVQCKLNDGTYTIIGFMED